MVPWMICSVALWGSALVFFPTPGWGADRGPIPAFGNQSMSPVRVTHLGTTADHDYYTANLDAGNKHLLFQVESFHLHQQVFDNFSAGRYEAALADLKYTLERFPNHPKALQMVGAIARLTGDLLLPLPFYKKAIRLFPEYAQTHAQYGSYLVDIGHLEGGITELNTAIGINPKLAIAHAWLAKAYYRANNPTLARQAAEEARQLGYKGKIPGEGPEKTDP